jgi:hypothetical protein
MKSHKTARERPQHYGWWSWSKMREKGSGRDSGRSHSERSKRDFERRSRRADRASRGSQRREEEANPDDPTEPCDEKLQQ